MPRLSEQGRKLLHLIFCPLLGIPSATVNRILRENTLQPHRLRTFTFSPGPQFGEKLLEVVTLYMNPPDNAVVLCVDEKTGIQALDRTQPMLPLRATKPRSWTNEYVRHGTRTLLASLDIGTGRIIADVPKRRTSKDFLAFLDSVKFTEWTPDDRLRQPVFLGLREDKKASEVMREKAT